MRVKKKLNGFLNKYGKSLCAMATIITSYGVLSCRGTFYQPKEPDGLSGFTKSIRWEEHIMENATIIIYNNFEIGECLYGDNNF